MAFTFYRQLDTNDCGPTCLRMISKYYGRDISIEVLRKITKLEGNGTSLLKLRDAATSLGLKSRGIRSSYESLIKIKKPSILHLNENHFVVFISGDESFATIADPSVGIIKIKRNDFIEIWASKRDGKLGIGHILKLEPTKRFSQNSSPAVEKLTWLSLRKYLFPNRLRIVQIVVSLILTSGLQLIFPFLTQSIVDTGINTSDLQYITIVLIAQLTITFSSTIVIFIRSRIQLKLSNIVNISILSDFWNKLTRLPISYFDTQKIGDTIQRINDNKQVQSFLTGQAMTTLYSLCNFLVYSIVLAVYGIKLFLIFLLGNALYFTWIMLFMRARRKLNFEIFDISSKENNLTFQFVQGMQEIKLNNAENRKRWEWENIQLKIFEMNFKSLNYGQIQSAGALFISQGKDLLISFMVAQQVVNGQLSFGAMLAIQYIIGSLSGPINDFIILTQTFQGAKISMERLNEIYLKDDEVSESKTYLYDLPKNHSIKLQNVSFSYPENKESIILKNIDLEISERKVTAIVGMSGSGKSTLLKLLLQIQSNYKGKIVIGDTDIQHINPNLWRSKCGVVNQDGFIFNDTISRNIAIGDEGIDIERLAECCRLSNILSFIETQPKKFNTIIGKDINMISQGQKQRLLIARAIYRNPDFLFLDEATSSLDSNNENEILKNLNTAFEGKTVVVVAHRLSTVRAADKIVVLDQGKIIETGSHSELTKLKGKYFELIRNQLELGS